LSKDFLSRLVLWLSMDIFPFRDERLTAARLSSPQPFASHLLGIALSLPIHVHPEKPD